MSVVSKFPAAVKMWSNGTTQRSPFAFSNEFDEEGVSNFDQMVKNASDFGTGSAELVVLNNQQEFDQFLKTWFPHELI